VIPAAALILIAAETPAATHPDLIPKRDVAITYRVSEAGKTLEERVRWLGGADIERVDLPGPVYMIADFRTHRLSLVDKAKHSVLELEAPRESVTHPDASAAWTKVGEAKVAGLDCTEWRLTVSGTEPQQLCATPDGVLLRVEVMGKPIVEAQSVRFEKLDPKLFEVPVSYERAVPPAAAPPPPGTGAVPIEP
jgi:hypothetical protein